MHICGKSDQWLWFNEGKNNPYKNGTQDTANQTKFKLLVINNNSAWGPVLAFELCWTGVHISARFSWFKFNKIVIIRSSLWSRVCLSNLRMSSKYYLQACGSRAHFKANSWMKMIGTCKDWFHDLQKISLHLDNINPEASIIWIDPWKLENTNGASGPPLMRRITSQLAKQEIIGSFTLRSRDSSPPLKILRRNLNCDWNVIGWNWNT